MMDEITFAAAEDSRKFPPRLIVGNRVWTETGYRQHGPENGPKIDIAPNQGGTITSCQENGYTRILGDLLHTVRWDDGQVSKHYSKDLFCIGRFQTRADFEQAINPTGTVELTVGPAGGFRHVRFELEYDGKREKAELYNRDFWYDCVELLVNRAGCTVSTKVLPGKKRPKPGSSTP
ncbi:MAG: hypothetical protein WCF30_21230 [Terracidiphilus sp.]